MPDALVELLPERLRPVLASNVGRNFEDDADLNAGACALPQTRDPVSPPKWQSKIPRTHHGGNATASDSLGCESEPHLN
jgi:hypothetical protein